MTVGEFKKYLEDNNVEDSMPMGIFDITTDDVHDSNYPIEKENLSIQQAVDLDDPSEIVGEILLFVFENKLNQNPI